MRRQLINHFLLLLVLAGHWVDGAAQQRSQQTFQLNSFSVQLNGAVHFLDADYAIHLPGHITDAFAQGFVIPLALEAEVYQKREFWLDREVAYIKQKYRLKYYPLLESVSFSNVNQGRLQFFSDLKEALMHVGRIHHYPLLDDNRLEADNRYIARIRLGIDINELPIPFKSSSFWEQDWALHSDWHEWELQR